MKLKGHNTEVFFSSTKGTKDVTITIFYETDFELLWPSWATVVKLIRSKYYFPVNSDYMSK